MWLVNTFLFDFAFFSENCLKVAILLSRTVIMTPSPIGAIESVNAFLNVISVRAAEMYDVKVSKSQLRFLLFCLSTMVLHGHLMGTSIALQSLGALSASTVSYMLRSSSTPFLELWKAAVCILFEIYNPTRACLIIDDTDRPRCKVIKRLGFVFKTICKVTGGYILAQNVVFVCLVTDKFTIPIAFRFYVPDPELKKWREEIKRLVKAKIPKQNHPIKPTPDPNYPSRIAMCSSLLSDAKELLREVINHLNSLNYGRQYCIKIIAVIADAAYMSPQMTAIVKQVMGTQVNFISQLKKVQLCIRQGHEVSIQNYFLNLPKQKSDIKIRGKSRIIEWAAARIFIKSHGKRLHVITLRYEGEDDWRYVAATDLTWRSQDVIQAYGLRWLVETFNEDWKQHGGWGKKAFQQGDDGCIRGFILSLLIDTYYLWHPTQVRLHRSGQPLCTVGSLLGRIRIEYVVTTIEAILLSPDPKAQLQHLKETIDKIFVLRPSVKHCADGAGFEFQEMLPSPFLKKKWGSNSA
jgi:hypothetical protein